MKDSEKTIELSKNPMAILSEKIGSHSIRRSGSDKDFQNTAIMNARKITAEVITAKEITAKKIIAERITAKKITAKKIMAERILAKEDFGDQNLSEMVNAELDEVSLEDVTIIVGELTDVQIIECDITKANIIDADWVDHLRGDEGYYPLHIDPILIKSSKTSNPENITHCSIEVFLGRINSEESSLEDSRQSHKSKFFHEDIMKKNEEKDNREELTSSIGDSLSPTTLSASNSPKSRLYSVRNSENFDNDIGEKFPKKMVETSDSPTKSSAHLRGSFSPETARNGGRFI